MSEKKIFKNEFCCSMKLYCIFKTLKGEVWKKLKGKKGL